MKTLLNTILIIMILGSLLVSCKDKDIRIPAEQRYLSHVTDEKGKKVLEFTYDEQNRIKAVDFSSPIRFIYDAQGQVEQIFIGANEWRYFYGGDGRPTGYRFGDDLYQITFSAFENTYTVLPPEGRKQVFYFDELNRCVRWNDVNRSDIYFFYENKKGPLNNGGFGMANYFGELSIFTFLAQANVLPFPLEAIMSKWAEGEGYVSFDNTYDSDGFLVKTQQTVKSTDYVTREVLETKLSYTYHYKKL